MVRPVEIFSCRKLRAILEHTYTSRWILRNSVLRREAAAARGGGDRGPRDVEHDPENNVRGVARLHISASN